MDMGNSRAAAHARLLGLRLTLVSLRLRAPRQTRQGSTFLRHAARSNGFITDDSRPRPSVQTSTRLDGPVAKRLMKISIIWSGSYSPPSEEFPMRLPKLLMKR